MTDFFPTDMLSKSVARIIVRNDVGSGKDVDRLRTLPSLSALHAHKNLAFIGPTGTGKTHLAMAFGHACCQQKLKTYFIKMSELNDMFTTARRFGNEGKIISNLVKQSCLIIDEVGHCVFDAENTRLFFDLVDCRYNKEGNFNMVFTSNSMPGTWRDKFNEDDSLLCALDRIFDDAIVFKLSGQSYRLKEKLDAHRWVAQISAGQMAQISLGSSGSNFNRPRYRLVN